jgi:hypothetical protein
MLFRIENEQQDAHPNFFVQAKEYDSTVPVVTEEPECKSINTVPVVTEESESGSFVSPSISESSLSDILLQLPVIVMYLIFALLQLCSLSVGAELKIFKCFCDRPCKIGLFFYLYIDLLYSAYCSEVALFKQYCIVDASLQ